MNVGAALCIVFSVTLFVVTGMKVAQPSDASSLLPAQRHLERSAQELGTIQRINCRREADIITYFISSNTLYELNDCNMTIHFIFSMSETSTSNVTFLVNGGTALPQFFYSASSTPRILSDVIISVVGVVSDIVFGMPSNGFLMINNPSCTIRRFSVEIFNSTIICPKDALFMTIGINSNVASEISCVIVSSTIRAELRQFEHTSYSMVNVFALSATMSSIFIFVQSSELTVMMDNCDTSNAVDCRVPSSARALAVYGSAANFSGVRVFVNDSQISNGFLMINNPSCTIRRFSVEIFNSTIICPKDALFMTIGINSNVASEISCVIVSSTIRAELRQFEHTSYSMVNVFANSATMSSIFIFVQSSELTVMMDNCDTSNAVDCRVPSSARALAVYGSAANFSGVRVFVNDSQIKLISTSANETVFTQLAVIYIEGITTAPVTLNNASITIINVVGNLSAAQIVLIFFDKIKTLSNTSVLADNVSVVGSMSLLSAGDTRQGAVVSVNVGLSMTSLFVTISNVSFYVVIQVSPPATITTSSLVSMVLIFSPYHAGERFHIRDSCIDVMTAVVPSSMSPFAISLPDVRINFVALQTKVNASTRITVYVLGSEVMIERCHLNATLLSIEAAISSSTTMLVQHSFFACDASHSLLLDIRITSSLLQVYIGIPIGFSKLSTSDVIVAFITLNDPRVLVYGRAMVNSPVLAPLLPPSLRGSTTVQESANLEVFSCNISVIRTTTSNVGPIYTGISTVSLPSNASSSVISIFDAIVSAREQSSSSRSPLLVNAILCAISCVLRNLSTVSLHELQLLSARSSVLHVLNTDPTSSLGSSAVLLVIDSSIDLANFSSNGSLYPMISSSVADDDSRVVATFAGASTVHIDACVFYFIDVLFGDNVDWHRAPSSPSPRLYLGCNQASFAPSASLRLLLPRNAFSNASLNNDISVTCPAILATVSKSPVILPTATAARTPAAVATSSLIVALLSVQTIAPSSAVATASLHSIQATLVIQRKRAMCTQQEQAMINFQNGDVDKSSSSMCCDVGTSSTQLTIGGNANGPLTPLLIGTIIGNVSLIAALAFLKWLLIEAQRASSSSSTKRLSKFLWGLPLRRSGIISMMWDPYSMLVTPTLGASVALILLPRTSGGLVAIGVLGLGALVVPWAASAFVLCWPWREMPFPFRGIVHREYRRGNIIHKLLKPSELLDAPLAARPYARQLLHGYGPVIEGYTARCYWYFNVETGISFASGIVMGLAYNEAERNPCYLWTDWMLLAFGVVDIALAVSVNPYLALLDLIALVLVVCRTRLVPPAAVYQRLPKQLSF
ncbi:membrane-associated protein, putative [Bodo saltans]|uniref:Membrane-associated protein, putative n=1 Tax=Bodo saltans TaxID=75058 RepID=A0A0S4IVI0_BODSA|nr:membrane-associated protein, putative [Bodo saltans]|eukprot:CUF56289.1 membrane-associated protein, putative [Bodo saltans]